MVFCHTQQESAIGTPISPPSEISLPSPFPPPVAEPQFEFPGSCSKSPLAICFTYGIVNFYVTLFPTFPLLPPLLPPVHTFLIYVYFSIPALKVNSSVPSLQIPYVCLSVWYLYFSFWLTSFCIIGSRFVHLIRTDSNVFLFMSE